MKYIYNNHNLLSDSESYMYTKFGGKDFIKSYFINRKSYLRNCEKKLIEPCSTTEIVCKAIFVLNQQFAADSLDQLSEIHLFFNKDDYRLIESSLHKKHIYDTRSYVSNSECKNISVNTLTLLYDLFNSIIFDLNNKLNKKLLDQLVQRFEVTKKLYEKYDADFKNGRGGYSLIEIYWIFGIVLCVYYSKTYRIKYLNTIIKVIDLVTSLPSEELKKAIPKYGLVLLLNTEILFVKLLLKRKKIEYLYE